MKNFYRIIELNDIEAPLKTGYCNVELATDMDIRLNIDQGTVMAPVRFWKEKDGKRYDEHVRFIDVDLSGGKAEAQQGKITVNEENLEQKIFKML